MKTGSPARARKTRASVTPDAPELVNSSEEFQDRDADKDGFLIKRTETQSDKNRRGNSLGSRNEFAGRDSFRHPDPHRILGAHVTPAGIAIRVFRPEAETGGGTDR